MPFEIAIHQWREGERRLDAMAPEQGVAADRVSEAIYQELRRRLGGGSFTADELAALYDAGTDWCLGVSVAVAPGAPWAWDVRTVADAAFARYVRQATDYAGGRRTESMP